MSLCQYCDINTMLMSGVSPKAFGDNVIKSVKDVKQPVNDLSNYRPIKIIPIVAKVFEFFMNSILDTFFNFHKNQFGFVKNVGCNKVIFIVRSCFE